MKYFRIISLYVEHDYATKNSHNSKINRIRGKFMIMNVQISYRITYISIIIFKFLKFYEI